MMERREGAPHASDGFGLVEVIIAMALLMVVAVSMLPVVISSIYLSKGNVSLTTATQVVAEQLDQARFISPTCDAIHQFVDETLGRTTTDPQGTILVISFTTEATCPTPTSYPAAFPLTVTVTDQATGREIAEATTRVLITRESE